MKAIIISLIAVGTLSLTTGCVTVKREPRTHSTTSTTEQTTTSRPRSATVETQTVRSY
ncbi:MAG: hypothetical protein WCQ16_02635 [Verrucomicrobiae bacterium]